MPDIDPTAGSSGGGFGGSYGSAISGLGSAAGDLFKGFATKSADDAVAAGLRGQADGSNMEAQGLFDAANMEGYNAAWAGASSDIQIAQQMRKNYKVQSLVQQEEGSAGFNGGGSGGDIMRENAQQGAMATQLLGVQKAINVNTYKIQQNSYDSQGKAALNAANAASAGASAANAAGDSAKTQAMISAGVTIAATAAMFF